WMWKLRESGEYSYLEVTCPRHLMGTAKFLSGLSMHLHSAMTTNSTSPRSMPLAQEIRTAVAPFGSITGEAADPVGQLHRLVTPVISTSAGSQLRISTVAELSQFCGTWPKSICGGSATTASAGGERYP